MLHNNILSMRTSIMIVGAVGLYNEIRQLKAIIIEMRANLEAARFDIEKASQVSSLAYPEEIQQLKATTIILRSELESMKLEKDAAVQREAHGRLSFKAGNWDKAIKLFNECLKSNPEDNLSNIYIDRCLVMKDKNPADWDGVWIMTSK